MLQYSNMLASKNYFQDRLVLLLLSINAFLAFLASILVLLRIGGAGNSGYITQFRANLGISAYKAGSLLSILSFIGFALVVLGVHAVLGWKVYHIKRQLSLVVLVLGMLLLVLCIIVSNALLVLR